MSSANRAALEAIADELRTLSGRGDSPAERLESAGRLLIEALEAGAFAGPQFAGLRAVVRQRFEQPEGNGFISAWCEAVWWLQGRPEAISDPAGDLAGDIDLVIAGMPRRPKSRKRPGRPQDTNPERDRRVSEAWSSSGCRSFEEFASADAGRRFRMSARRLKAACERYHKRQSRRSVK